MNEEDLLKLRATERAENSCDWPGYFGYGPPAFDAWWRTYKAPPGPFYHSDYARAGWEAALEQQAAQQPASDPCPDCNGSGERMQSTWGHGPDDYEYPIDCKTCDGTGAAPAAQQPAEPLREALERIKEMAGADTGGRATWEIFEIARAALAHPPAAPVAQADAMRAVLGEHK